MDRERDSYEAVVVPLDEMFKAYCKMDPLSRAMGIELLPLTQSDKWMQDANVLDMITVTTTDTGLCFFKFRKRALDFQQFLEYIEDLVKFKKLNLDDVKYKLQTCVKPVHPDDKKKKKKGKPM